MLRRQARLNLLNLIRHCLAFPTPCHCRTPGLRSSSNYCAILDDCILGDDDYAVANKVTTARTIGFGNPSFIQQSGVDAHTRVLIDDCVLDNTSLPYPDSRHPAHLINSHVFKRLVIVSSHNVRRINMYALRDPTAQTNHTVLNLRSIDDAAVTKYRVVDLSVLDL